MVAARRASGRRYRCDVTADLLPSPFPAVEAIVTLPPAATPPEKTAATIDVPPPHHALRTWRNFFVHVARPHSRSPSAVQPRKIREPIGKLAWS